MFAYYVFCLRFMALKSGKLQINGGDARHEVDKQGGSELQDTPTNNHWMNESG